MAESIKRDERIRLKDGRLMTLDAAKLGEGKYEVMLLDLKTGEDLDTVMVPTEAEALEEFERLRERWPPPEAMPAELKGKYRKLAEDLKAALAYGLERKGDDDGGPVTSMPPPCTSPAGRGRRSRPPPNTLAWAASSGICGAVSPSSSPSRWAVAWARATPGRRPPRPCGSIWRAWGTMP